MSTSRKRDGRRLTDAEVESADAWHWISIGVACDRLLERLVKHHEKKTAPVAKQEPSKRSGHGDQSSAF
jgi:hypothetical protein